MRLIFFAIYLQCYKIEIFLHRIKHHLAFENPNSGAIVYLSFFESINIFTVLWILGFPKQDVHKFLILITMIILFALNYFIIFKRRKYEVILVKYAQYNDLKKRLVDAIGILYLVITCVIPFIV
jgi:hypothetical protein